MTNLERTAALHIPIAFKGLRPRSPEELCHWLDETREAALEPDLPIIDPHHHLWDDARGRYLVQELSDDVASGHRVVATVFVEAMSMYRAAGPKERRALGEVEFARGMAAISASGLFGQARLCDGIVGFADLALGDKVEAELADLVLASGGRLRGIRYPLSWDDSDFMRHFQRQPHPRMSADPGFRIGLARMAELGLVFEAWLYHPQLAEAVALARAVPSLCVVLNHAGGPLGIGPYAGRRQEIFETWRESIRELATCPNVVVKLGGLGMIFAGFDFHERSRASSSETLAAAWRPYVETCIAAFGTWRCMFESNFPVDKQSCDYGVLWNAFKRITAGCSADEKGALYCETAARVYRMSAEQSS